MQSIIRGFCLFARIFKHNLCEKQWMTVVKMVSRKIDGKDEV